jgi:hypothetical protein
MVRCGLMGRTERCLLSSCRLSSCDMCVDWGRATAALVRSPAKAGRKAAVAGLPERGGESASGV